MRVHHSDKDKENPSCGDVAAVRQKAMAEAVFATRSNLRERYASQGIALLMMDAATAGYVAAPSALLSYRGTLVKTRELRRIINFLTVSKGVQIKDTDCLFHRK